MTDRHAAAFRDATPADWTTDDPHEHPGELVVHLPGDEATPIRTPEDHEADSWDADAQPPKTLAEARRALAERVADPSAPDSDAEAYDELDGDA